jgi:succinylglutamate desuccinylase
MGNIIRIGKDGNGPISVILAGVHGDEKCGIIALEEVLPQLEIKYGCVFFGYGNPRAIKKNVRYTEANLNRMFNYDKKISLKEKKSYEYQRAQFLKIYLDKAEALLDIHASSIPNSKAFAICEPNAKKLVEYLPIDITVSGFDEMEPGGTDFYMNSQGKIGICLECGSIQDPRSIEIAKESIFSFLKARGHITNNLVPRKQTWIQIFEKYFAKASTFTLSKPFKNFELLNQKQLIGIDGEKEVVASKQSLILFAHNGNKIGDEVFMLGEKRSLAR